MPGHDSILQMVQQAIGLHQSGDLAAAEKAYRRVLAASPSQFEALHFLGLIKAQQGYLSEADRLISRSLLAGPQRPEPYSNHARILRQLNRPHDALTSCDRALAFDARFVDALIIRCNALRDLGRLEAALASIDRALALAPDHFVALAARGDVLAKLKRYDQACACYDRALKLEPRYANAWNSRGSALHEMGRYQEALACYDSAIAIQADYADAFNNRGLALRELEQWSEALDSFDKAVAISPGHADALYNRGSTLLLTGHLAKGWPDYEHRFDIREPTTSRPALSAAEWKGEPLNGKSLVIHAEQGLGDTMQFVRYLPLLRDSGAAITAVVPGNLRRLLAPLGDHAELQAAADGRPFDFRCALASLPLRFGTQVASIPRNVPYLRAEPDLAVRWRASIGDHGFKVGICWQGNPSGVVDKGRSVPLRQFFPLSQIPDIRLISLQRQHGLDQLEQLPLAMKVETLPDTFDAGPDAFIDSAAVMSNLDLIVTSDTSIAHLAGALGRPAWVALKRVPDWRWLLDRHDSPWYPSLRLFRQPARGSWEGVFATMAEALRALVSDRRG